MNDPTAGEAPASRPGAHAPAAASTGPLGELASQLYSHAFQPISLLAIAAAGGALVMQQVGIFKTRPWTGVAAAVILALAALASVLGSMELARGATEQRDVRKSLRRLQSTAFFLLGAGTGLLLMGIVRNALA